MFLAGFLTMTVDETNSYLVTGDAEGVIKVWDISEYCAACTADDDSPPRKSTFDINCSLHNSLFLCIIPFVCCPRGNLLSGAACIVSNGQWLRFSISQKVDFLMFGLCRWWNEENVEMSSYVQQFISRFGVCHNLLTICLYTDSCRSSGSYKFDGDVRP